MNKFVKSFLLVSFLTYAFAGLAFAEDAKSIEGAKLGSLTVKGQKYYMGCIPPSKDKLSKFPKASLPLGARLPSDVDLSVDFPTPGNQGQQGSCVGWATAYAYKTFQEKLDHEWSISTLDHKFSPAYVYNQINGGRDQGSSIDDAMDLMKKQGVCSLQAMPYNDSNYTVKPTEAQKKLALPHKSKTWGVTSAGDVNAIKVHLAAGDAVTVGVPIYGDFADISESNPVYHGTGGDLQGYHALCIVGYDDAKQAFKFINSWGSEWGIGGFGYMGYDFIKKENVTGYIMTDVPEGPEGIKGNKEKIMIDGTKGNKEKIMIDATKGNKEKIMIDATKENKEKIMIDATKGNKGKIVTDAPKGNKEKVVTDAPKENKGKVVTDAPEVNKEVNKGEIEIDAPEGK